MIYVTVLKIILINEYMNDSGFHTGSHKALLQLFVVVFDFLKIFRWKLIA